MKKTLLITSFANVNSFNSYSYRFPRKRFVEPENDKIQRRPGLIIRVLAMVKKTGSRFSSVKSRIRQFWLSQSDFLSEKVRQAMKQIMALPHHLCVLLPSILYSWCTQKLLLNKKQKAYYILASIKHRYIRKYCFC